MRRRFEWRGSDGAISDVDFHLGHGDMVRLLRRSGFEIDDLVELQAPAEGGDEWPHISLEWARRWPSAEVWKAHKTDRAKWCKRGDSNSHGPSATGS
jgi:hypothetical protein